MNATLVVDYGADAAYLQLSEDAVHETCPAAEGVLVDLSEMRIVVGVEVLALDAHIPRELLIRDFHMRSEDLAIFDSIRPNVTSFVQRRQSETSVTTAAQRGALETCS